MFDWKLLEGCGGDLASLHGSFSSPSYPNSYPLSTECIWRITASPGYFMTNLHDKKREMTYSNI